MAQEPAQAASSPKSGASLRRLWQVPTFLAGVLAVAIAWIVHPAERDQGASQLNHDLAAERRALDPAHLNLPGAITLGESILLRVARFPQRSGEAHFLLGSAYARKAAAASGEEAAAAWHQARSHLEEALNLGVPSADRPALVVRLGKACFQTGAAPQRVIDYLAMAVDVPGEDPGEIDGMLAQSYLRLPVPDLRAALAANQKRLDLPTENDNLLAPARLLHGELLLQLKEEEEARKILARIGPSAPGDTYARARWLRAKSCQEAGLWQEAAALWEEIGGDAHTPADKLDRLKYELGHCYRRLDRPVEAARAWESILGQPGEWGQAAALSLAEVRLTGSQVATALECFERSVRGVANASAYHNSQVDLSEARRLFEFGCQVYRKVKDFQSALALAHLYHPLAPPGTEQELVALAADAWAQDCQSQALASKTPEAAHTLWDEARTHLREAGAAYEGLANLAGTREDQAQWLRRGAERFFQAQDYSRGEILLQRYLGVEVFPERLGEGWFALAEVYRALKREADARAAYLKCIEHSGPYASRARFQLAQEQFDQGRLDEAEAALKLNLELMQGSPDQEAQERSLYALAGLLLQRGSYQMASLRLQEILDRYPDRPRATQARSQLAGCYRRLAAQEDQKLHGSAHMTPETRLHFTEQTHHWLELALANYQKLVEELKARQAAGWLAEADAEILIRAEFAQCECAFDLGQYREAIRLYEIIFPRYPHQVEGLMALKQITRCYWLLNEAGQAREVVKRLRTTLKDLKDTAFSDQAADTSRAYWEEWLDWASQQ